jgi:hypothetical protein
VKYRFGIDHPARKQWYSCYRKQVIEATTEDVRETMFCDGFIFPNPDGGFMDTSNYRSRVLKPLAGALGIPKLNFQVIRRTIATRAQSLGSVKDI